MSRRPELGGELLDHRKAAALFVDDYPAGQQGPDRACDESPLAGFHPGRAGAG